MGDGGTTGVWIGGIELEALEPHSYYDPAGVRVLHLPGDRYTVYDAVGLTARQLAAALIEAKWAKPAGPRRGRPPKELAH